MDFPKLPISIRDVAPGPNAERLTGVRPDGSSDGFHTGGAWKMGDKVYKPLDGRPWANADFHTRTREDEVLELMADKPFFPRNWTISQLNGRRWLVRDVCSIVSPVNLSMRALLKLEEAVRSLNALGWEINDDIVIATDLKHRPFILDLSAAQTYFSRGRPEADDLSALGRYMEDAGDNGKRIVAIRRQAKSVLNGVPLMDRLLIAGGDELGNLLKYRYVYASFCRPLNHVDIDGFLISSGDTPSLDDGIAYTWLVTDHRLSSTEMDRYELSLAWWPIEYNPSATLIA